MMTTRWSLFTSVVERVVVLIFVEEERKEEGTNTFLEVRRTTFQVNYSYDIPSYSYTNYYNIKLKLSHHSCVYPPPGFSNSGTARYPLDFNA